MKRWQRRAHLWIWLLVAAVVVMTVARLVQEPPHVSGGFQ